MTAPDEQAPQAVEETVIWAALRQVEDPELGVDIVSLGLVEGIELRDGAVEVRLRETFVSCIAVPIMRSAVESVLGDLGLDVTIAAGTRWTGAEAGPEARRDLARLGITIDAGDGAIRCPYCESADVVLDSPFGSAPCRAAYSCRTCKTPFDVMRSASARMRAAAQIPLGKPPHRESSR